MAREYPKLYLEGIRLFNEREFFECHDAIEELWTDTHTAERRFLQGLIQAAVALYHFGNENLGGARKMYHAAVEKLRPYAPHYWGLDLDKFLADLRFCFEDLLQAGGGYPAGITLREDRIPRIEFRPEPNGPASESARGSASS